MQVQVYEKNGQIYGGTLVNVRNKQTGKIQRVRVPVMKVDLAQVEADLTQRIYAQLLATEGKDETGCIGRDEVGFVKKLFNKAKEAAKRAAKKVGLTKVVNFAKKKGTQLLAATKKVVESKAFAVAVGITAAVVPGAQALAPIYAGVRAAMALADRLKQGDPSAVAEIQKYVDMGPAGAKVVALVNQAKNAIPPLPNSANPWLQGMASPIKMLPEVRPILAA